MQGGKSLQDRELAAKVRTLALNRVDEVLKSRKPKKLYEAVLIRLSGSILPRLNEVTGQDGEPIAVTWQK